MARGRAVVGSEARRVRADGATRWNHGGQAQAGTNTSTRLPGASLGRSLGPHRPTTATLVLATSCCSHILRSSSPPAFPFVLVLVGPTGASNAFKPLFNKEPLSPAPSLSALAWQTWKGFLALWLSRVLLPRIALFPHATRRSRDLIRRSLQPPHPKPHEASVQLRHLSSPFHS